MLNPIDYWIFVGRGHRQSLHKPNETNKIRLGRTFRKNYALGRSLTNSNAVVLTFRVSELFFDTCSLSCIFVT